MSATSICCHCGASVEWGFPRREDLCLDCGKPIGVAEHDASAVVQLRAMKKVSPGLTLHGNWLYTHYEDVLALIEAGQAMNTPPFTVVLPGGITGPATGAVPTQVVIDYDQFQALAAAVARLTEPQT